MFRKSRFYMLLPNNNPAQIALNSILSIYMSRPAASTCDEFGSELPIFMHISVFDIRLVLFYVCPLFLSYFYTYQPEY